MVVMRNCGFGGTFGVFLTDSSGGSHLSFVALVALCHYGVLEPLHEVCPFAIYTFYECFLFLCHI